MTRSMSFFTKSLFALTIAGAALATNLQAQSEGVIVTVPFPFTMGTQTVAPGTYEFNLISSQFLLSVTNRKTGDVEMFPVHPERQSKVEEHGGLTFRSSAARNALNEVHFPGTDRFSELIQPRHARRNETLSSTAEKSVFVAGH